MKLFVIAVSSLFLIAGCKKDEYVEPDYVRGDLSFGIKDEVPIDKVFQLINDEHLDVENIHGFIYTCTYPKDSLQALKGYLSQKEYLWWPNSTNDTPGMYYNADQGGIKFIGAMFNMSDTSYQNDWLKTIEQFDLIDDNFSGKNLFIHVPEGSEKEWRDKLLQKDIVEWAELNYIIELDR